MKGGDISNEAPVSIYVNLDVLVTRAPEIGKVLGLIPTVRERTEVDLLAAAALDRIAMKSGVSWIGFAVDWDKDTLDFLIETLDRVGHNPFRWIVEYGDYAELVSELAYVSTLGVIDRPERALTFGSHYIDMDRVHGG